MLFVKLLGGDEVPILGQSLADAFVARD